MAKYKFDTFNVEIENPEIVEIQVVDNTRAKKASANVTFETPSAEASVIISFEGFTYTDDWNDEDIEAWVNTQMANYLIQ